MEKYVASTGEFEAWVTNTSTALSHSADTTFYMCYGNSSISSFQSTATSVWDSNDVGVWHFSNGTTLSASDSTSNNNGGTLSNAPTAVAGKIDGAANFNGSNQAMSAGSSPLGSIPVTVSGWVNINSFTQTTFSTGAGDYIGSVVFDTRNNNTDVSPTFIQGNSIIN